MNAKSLWRIVLPLGLSAFGAVSAGCASSASTLCSLECDCEHCNDYEEAVGCDSLATQQDIAGAYECADKWDSWATCVEERGRCEEKEARFTTSTPGSCSGTEPTGLTCMNDADCNGGQETCSAGMCMERVCAEGGGFCQDDADCSGEDACQTQEDDLETCIDNASAHGGVHFDFD